MTTSENSLPMTPEAILAAWSRYDYTFPKAAFEAALEQREAITPHLLELFNDVALYPDSLSNAEDYYPSVYALYLLAWFREKRTLPALKRVFELTGEDMFDLWGDTASEDGTRLFASWAQDDPAALHQIIEMKTKKSETTRGSALEAYIILYHTGIVTAEEMRPYLRHLADDVLERRSGSRDDWLWYSWARCCVDMGLENMYPLVKQAFDEKWIDPWITRWEDEEQSIQSGREAVLKRSREEYSGFIENPLVELSDWYCFTEAARKEDMRREHEAARTAPKLPARQHEPFHHPDTIVNTTPKPKPNKPCPCGSGKKYKKCCGRG